MEKVGLGQKFKELRACRQSGAARSSGQVLTDLNWKFKPVFQVQG